MNKEQKRKALHLLETPGTPNPDRETDRQTDITNLMFVFRNFEKAPKIIPPRDNL